MSGNENLLRERLQKIVEKQYFSLKTPRGLGFANQCS